MLGWLTKLREQLFPPKPVISAPVPIKTADTFAAVKWLDATDAKNSFGIRILDCLSTAMGLIAVTEDAHIARTYGKLRTDNGRRFIGQQPNDPVETECKLTYPLDGSVADGPIHVSRVMEDKWDIYLYEGKLYFARSWTGELYFVAAIELTSPLATITHVVAARAPVGSDAAYAIRVVDYLIKSHVYERCLPHPLPAFCPEDAKLIAIHSFRLFGRHAFAATYEDTTQFRVDWQPPRRSEGPTNQP